MGASLWLQWPGRMDNVRSDHVLGMMSDPVATASWPQVFRRTAWFVIRGTALRGGVFADSKRDRGGTDALYEVLAFCKRHGIKVAVNATSAGRAQCDGRSLLLAQEVEQFDRISALGFAIDAFQLQSVVSGTIHTPDCMDKYPKAGGMEKRIADVVRFCHAVLPDFPTARIILADTAAAKDDAEHGADWDYRRDYTALSNALVLAGLPEPSFHLAWSAEETAPDLSDVVAAATFFRENGWTCGLKPITDSANLSAKRFHKDLVGFVRRIGAAGALPDEITLTSWNRSYPTLLYPEWERGTLTAVGAAWAADGLIADT